MDFSSKCYLFVSVTLSGLVRISNCKTRCRWKDLSLLTLLLTNLLTSLLKAKWVQGGMYTSLLMGSYTTLAVRKGLIRNFFFADTASVHTYPMNAANESAIFWIRSPEWKFLNVPWIRNRVDAKSGYFLSDYVTRSNPVHFCERQLSKMEISCVLKWIRMRENEQIGFEYG